MSKYGRILVTSMFFFLCFQVCCKDLWYLEVQHPNQPNKVQLVRAQTGELELCWSTTPTAQAFRLQIQQYEVPPNVNYAGFPPVAITPTAKVSPKDGDKKPKAVSPKLKTTLSPTKVKPMVAVNKLSPATKVGIEIPVKKPQPITNSPPKANLVTVPSIKTNVKKDDLVDTPPIESANVKPAVSSSSGIPASGAMVISAPVPVKTPPSGIHPVKSSLASMLGVKLPITSGNIESPKTIGTSVVEAQTLQSSAAIVTTKVAPLTSPTGKVQQPRAGGVVQSIRSVVPIPNITQYASNIRGK